MEAAIESIPPQGWLTTRTMRAYLAGAWLWTPSEEANVSVARMEQDRPKRQSIVVGGEVYYGPEAQRLILADLGVVLRLGKDWPRLAFEAIERAVARTA